MPILESREEFIKNGCLKPLELARHLQARLAALDNPTPQLADFHDANTSRHASSLVNTMHPAWMRKQPEFYNTASPENSYNMARISGPGNHIVIAEAPASATDDAEHLSLRKFAKPTVGENALLPTNIIVALGSQEHVANYTTKPTATVDFVNQTLLRDSIEIKPVYFSDPQNGEPTPFGQHTYEARGLMPAEQQDQATAVRVLHLPCFGLSSDAVSQASKDTPAANLEMMIYLAESYQHFVVHDVDTTLSAQFALAIMLYQHRACIFLHESRMTLEDFSNVVIKYVKLIREVNPNALTKIEDIMYAVDTAWNMHTLALRQPIQSNNIEITKDKQRKIASTLQVAKIDANALNDLITKVITQKKSFASLPSFFLYRDGDNQTQESAKTQLLKTIQQKIGELKLKFDALNSTLPNVGTLMRQYANYMYRLTFYFLATAFQREIWGPFKTSSSGERCIDLINRDPTLKRVAITLNLKLTGKRLGHRKELYPKKPVTYHEICGTLSGADYNIDPRIAFYSEHREAALDHLHLAVAALNFDTPVPASFHFTDLITALNGVKTPAVAGPANTR